MSRNVVAICQARLNSARLPAKVLADIGGKPMIWRIVERAKCAKTVDAVVLAIPAKMADDPIEQLPWRIHVVRGSPDDVLARYANAADWAGADVIVRITGDNPLTDPAVIDKMVEVYLGTGLDYVSNVAPPTYPDGLDVEVFSRRALFMAHRLATKPSDREHVTTYIRNNPGLFSIGNVTHEPDLSRYRLTVDEKQDLDVIRQIFAVLGNDCTWQDAVAWLDAHPEVAVINQSIERNSGYAKSLEAERV